MSLLLGFFGLGLRNVSVAHSLLAIIELSVAVLVVLLQVGFFFLLLLGGLSASSAACTVGTAKVQATANRLAIRISFEASFFMGAQQ